MMFLKRIRKNSSVIDCPELSSFTSKKIIVRKGDALSSPFMIGALKPTLFLPNIKMTEEQFNNILLHEVTHFKRHDIWYKWIAMIVKCVHWFNPIIYFVARQISIECEISCDLTVVSGMNKQEKMSYIDTILAVLAGRKTKNIPLSTGMTSNKNQIKRRFMMIKNKTKISKKASVLSSFLAIAILCTTVFSSGVLANAIGVYEKDEIVYEVYNGGTKVNLNTIPFIYDGEYYLPLRDTLNGFGIGNISYNHGDISISLLENERNEMPQMVKLQVGENTVSFESPVFNSMVIRSEPLLRDDITYVSIDFFELLMQVAKVMPDFKLNVIRPTEPENYYTKGEDVFVGTVAEQDAYNPIDENGNRKIVKRIIVDENRRTIAVVPIENQKSKNIQQKLESVNKAQILNGYSDIHKSLLFLWSVIG